MTRYAIMYRLGIVPWERYGTAGKRGAEGQAVTALANPEATLLMLAFGRTRMRSLVEGVSQREVEDAFPDWEMLAVDSADTRGLGWPMNRTRPQWYRLRRRTSGGAR